MKKLIGRLMVVSLSLMMVAGSGSAIGGESGVRVVTVDGKTYLVAEHCKHSIEKCIQEARGSSGSNMEHDDYLGGG